MFIYKYGASASRFTFDSIDKALYTRKVILHVIVPTNSLWQQHYVVMMVHLKKMLCHSWGGCWSTQVSHRFSLHGCNFCLYPCENCIIQSVIYVQGWWQYSESNVQEQEYSSMIKWYNSLWPTGEISVLLPQFIKILLQWIAARNLFLQISLGNGILRNQKLNILIWTCY